MSSFPPAPPGPPGWPPGPPGPPGQSGTPGQSSGPYDQTVNAYSQPADPYGTASQPSGPYGQPASPYGPVGQAPAPPAPYGPVGQPPAAPYGPPVGQPMPQQGNQTHDPVVQFLHLALSGFGYNFYNTKNQARSDDLLVRAKASGFLTDASSALRTLADEYHRRYVPPLTREHPEPPREALAALDDMRLLQEEIGTLETHVRAMSVPTADHIWERFRAELPTLRQLMQFDLDLVRGAQNFFQQVSGMSADTWTPAQAHELRAMLRWLSQVAQAREHFLRMPT
jgi:hypothetical protein